MVQTEEVLSAGIKIIELLAHSFQHPVIVPVLMHGLRPVDMMAQAQVHFESLLLTDLPASAPIKDMMVLHRLFPEVPFQQHTQEALFTGLVL